MKKIINNPNAVVEEMLQVLKSRIRMFYMTGKASSLPARKKVIRSGLYPEEAAVMNRRMPAMSAMVCWMPQ